ncbi:MAG: hypothetical protein K6G81_02165 [Lachnospiraceae bacterium]|nr:hypothetical protein [Lachnospiraceae bacterium]
MDEKQIKKDILRYTKNSLSSGLTYLAILFNVLFFVNIYRSDVGNYYYTWLTGVSIIYNLLFMLTAFLCSEGVKKYHFGYSVTLLVIGALQYVRIFVIPKKASQAVINIGGVEEAVMKASQYRSAVAFLIVSGCLCIIAGVIGMIKSSSLKSYEAELAKNR